ncbi:MAG TPA: GIY-YIG nuclease family protein [Flavipsychrobacter sp.]
MKKKGTILYSEICNEQLQDAISYIMQAEKLPYGNITLDDLLIKAQLSDLKIKDYYSAEYFGAGAYIFFDKGTPVYVGKAKNFLHRFTSHRSIDVRGHWGWNALLQKICINRLGYVNKTAHTRDYYAEALQEAEQYEIVRILRDDDSVDISMIEKVLMRGINHIHPLWNGRVKRVKHDYLQKTIAELI